MDRANPAGRKSGPGKVLSGETLETIKELLERVGLKPRADNSGFDYRPYPGLEHYPPEAFEGEQSIDQVAYWDPLSHMFSEFPPDNDEAYFNKLSEMKEKFKDAFEELKKSLKTAEGRAEIKPLAEEYGFSRVEECVSSIEEYLTKL